MSIISFSSNVNSKIETDIVVSTDDFNCNQAIESGQVMQYDENLNQDGQGKLLNQDGNSNQSKKLNQDEQNKASSQVEQSYQIEKLNQNKQNKLSNQNKKSNAAALHPVLQLGSNIYYRKGSNANQAVIYLHGRNDNIQRILEQYITDDLYCLVSPNIIRKSPKDNIENRYNWFFGYVPLRLVAPLCVNYLLKDLHQENHYLSDHMYRDLFDEINFHLSPLIDDLYDKIKTYKSVKIVGFSQGGMAAHMLANQLKKRGVDIDIVISIGSFMITDSDINTILINNVQDKVISWKGFLGSINKFWKGENLYAIKVNNDILHRHWPWVNGFIGDLCNLTDYNHDAITDIVNKYEYEYDMNVINNELLKAKYGFVDYLIFVVYYITYVPATILKYLMNLW